MRKKRSWESEERELKEGSIGEPFLLFSFSWGRWGTLGVNGGLFKE